MKQLFFNKLRIVFLVSLVLFSCRGKEDFSLNGVYKDPILNISQDLMVVYRSFHLANYCATDTTEARRVFDIQVKNNGLNSTFNVNYKNTVSIYNPYIYNPAITSGKFELKYQNPYLNNFTNYAFLELNNLKNNNSVYNGKIYFNKSIVNANISYYYVYTDSLKVTTPTKSYYIKGNLTLNEQFNANGSFTVGSIEAYNGMNAKLVLTDFFRAENDYKNRFGLKNTQSYYFVSGKAVFSSENYNANIHLGDISSNVGKIPFLNVTDGKTRYFSEYPKF